MSVEKDEPRMTAVLSRR